MQPVFCNCFQIEWEKALLEDTSFFPHDGESRGRTLWPFPVKGMGDPYLGAACILSRAWSGVS